jgi:hypothetical protein
MILLKTLPTLFFEGTVSPAFSTPVFFHRKNCMRFCVQEWFKEVHAFIETYKFRHISMPDRMHLLLRTVP